MVAPRRMRLRCQERGYPSGSEAKLWRLYLVDDPDEDEESVLAAYCPTCAVREFGESRAERTRTE